MEDEQKTKSQLIAELQTSRRRAVRLESSLADLKRVEEALEESESLSRRLFEKTLNPVLVVNDKGEYINANSAALSFLETERDQLLGKSVWDYSPEDALQNQKREHTPFTRPRALETVYQVNEKRKTLLLNVVPVETVKGTILYGIGQDITERKRAEKALRKREEQYRSLYENIPVGVFRSTPDGKLVSVNRSLVRMLGYESANELKRIPTPEIYGDPERRNVLLARILEEGSVENFEITARRRDGSRIHVSTNIRATCDSEGNILFLDGIGKDVTERKRAEEALHKSEKNLAKAQEIAHLGSWEWDMMTGEIEWSDEMHRIYGVEPGAKLVNDVVYELIHPDDKSTFDRAIAEAPTGAAPSVIEYRINRADGQTRHVRSKAEMFYDESGNLLRMLGTVQDVTGRKQAEKALRDAEWRYRTVADFTYDWESWENPDGTLRYVSPAFERITGYAVEQLKDAPLLLEAIILPEDLAIWAAHRRDAVESPGPYEIQFRIRRRDGAISWIEHACRPVVDEQGAFLGYRASNRDITRRKQAEEALRARTRELVLLNDAGQAFASSLELDETLAAAVEQTRRIIGSVACSIWLVDPRRGDLVCREAAPPRDDIVRGWRLAPGQGLAGWVVRHGEILNIPDACADKRHFKGVDKRTGLQLRSILSAPLRTRKGVLGVLQLLDKARNRFGESDARLAESLAAMAAAAIEKARLHRQTRRDAETKTILLQEVNHRVTNNLAAITGMLYIEQSHISRSAGPGEQAARLDELANRIKGLSTAHRLLSGSDWSPLPLGDLARNVIGSALQALPSDRRVSVDVFDAAPVMVTPGDTHNLAIVINELGSNVVKHAAPAKETTRVAVRVARGPDGESVVIEFRDDGPGFPPAVLRSGGRNVGLYLVENTVRHSLRGEIALHNDDGAVATITFIEETGV